MSGQQQQQQPQLPQQQQQQQQQQSGIRYTPNQQFVARPGQLGMAAAPHQLQLQQQQLQQQHQQQQHQQQHQQQQQQQQRPPMMQFRPGMPQQQPPPQTYMGATNPRSGNGNVTAAYNLIQQQQHMRPSSGRPSAPTATYQNTNINIAGVVVGQAPQPHPALIQPQIPTARKRKTNKLTATTPTAASASASAATTVAGGAADSAMDDSVSGDEIDVQPYAVAVGRYQNNHNLMSEIFVALPNSAVELPRHYYEELDRVVVERDLGRLEVEAKECERAHAERVEAVERGRGEFRGVMEELARAGAGDVDMVRAKLADVLGMEFVDNPFRTMERVPVDRVDAVEGAVYKQL